MNSGYAMRYNHIRCEGLSYPRVATIITMGLLFL
jgi:hypothetical protein